MNTPMVDKKTGEVTLAKSHAWFSTRPSRTKQGPRKESDINAIVARGRSVGYLPPAHRQVFYGDISAVPTYEEAFNRVQAAQEAFRRLPSGLREKLGNNPQNLVPYIRDEKNRGDCEKYGLLKPREKPNEKQTQTKNDIKTPENQTSPAETKSPAS